VKSEIQSSGKRQVAKRHEKSNEVLRKTGWRWSTLELGLWTLFGQAPHDNPVASEAKLKLLGALRIGNLANGIDGILSPSHYVSQPVGGDTGTPWIAFVILGMEFEQVDGREHGQGGSRCVYDSLSHISVRRLRVQCALAWRFLSLLFVESRLNNYLTTTVERE
jgi:hypothetical protein